MVIVDANQCVPKKLGKPLQCTFALYPAKVSRLKEEDFNLVVEIKNKINAEINNDM
jgi:hypothetical protein